MKLQSVTVLASLLAAATADQLNLVNCQIGAGLRFSQIAYYAAGAGPNGLEPSSNNVCTLGSEVTWEGNTIDCSFSTGVEVQTNINSDGQSVGDFNFAGTATNFYENFNCYEDVQEVLYTVYNEEEGPAQCNSIYYCLS